MRVTEAPPAAAAREKWDFANDGLVMVEFHRVETERNRVKDLTGSRVRISDTSSCGMDSGRVLSSSSSVIFRSY